MQTARHANRRASRSALRGAGDTAEVIRIANVKPGRTQIDVIESIEEFRTELQLLRFREPEILGSRAST